MSTGVDKPSLSDQRPRVAVALSLLSLGLGHLYAGRGRRALLVFVMAPMAVIVIELLIALLPFQRANVLVPLAVALALLALVALDAARAARTAGSVRPNPIFSRWSFCVAAYLLVSMWNSLWFAVCVTTLVQAYRVQGAAMNNTPLNGDRVLAIKWVYGWRNPLFPDRVLFGERHPARGDVVVFLYPRDRSVSFIQRIVGLPGETCEIWRGRVLINRKPLDEPYVRPAR